MVKSLRNKQLDKAQALSDHGLAHYASWELSEAIDHLRDAVRLAPSRADHHLNLARALARAGDYDLALKSVADFLAHEGSGPTAARLQRVLSSGLDKVEKVLTTKMSARGAALDEIGAALQMWLEFRIAMGRGPIAKSTPQAWSAALDYTIQKINYHEADLDSLSSHYGSTDATVRRRHRALLQALDLMPCDYRYFIGRENPLDKLVEAAAMLEELGRRFTQD